MESLCPSCRNFLPMYMRHWALVEDSFDDAQPLVYDVESPEEIEDFLESDFIIKG